MNKGDIVIVGEMPSHRDFKNGTRMKHGKYKIVSDITEYALTDETGQPYSQDCFTVLYAIDEPLYPNDFHKLEPKDWKANTLPEELLDYIISLSPKVIMPIGAKLLPFFCSEKKITVAANKIYDLDGIKVMPNTAPTTGYGDKEKHLRAFAMRFDEAVREIHNTQINVQRTKYKIVKSLPEFLEVIEYCKQTGVFCYDFETTGLEWYVPEIVPTILSVSFQAGFSYIIPLFHKEPLIANGEVFDFGDPVFNSNEVEYIFETINDDIFGNPNVIKIAHNMKFDAHFMLRYGVTKKEGRFFDTMLAHQILDENMAHGLKVLTAQYFPQFAGYEDEVTGFDWDSTPLDILSKYAAIDTDITYRLFIHFEEQLIRDDPENKLYLLFRHLTMSAFWPLLRAEHRGARIHRTKLDDTIVEITEMIETINADMLTDPTVNKYVTYKKKQFNTVKIEEYKERRAKHSEGSRWYINYTERIDLLVIGETTEYKGFNFNSVKQLQDLLYFSEHGFQFPQHYDEMSKEYSPSTARIHLRYFDEQVLIKLFAIKSLKKMLSTYYIGIRDKLDSEGYIHTSFLQHGTRTGRLSCRNPNLQNIPARIHFDHEGAKRILKTIKKLFGNLDDKHVMLQGDYSQAELRMIANVSNDPAMVEAYLSGIDVHDITGQALAPELSKEEYFARKAARGDWYDKHRVFAKCTNFGLCYGQSAMGWMGFLADVADIHLTKKEAYTKREVYHKRFAGVIRWHERCKKEVTKNGYIRTLFGRKRRLPSAQRYNAESEQKKAFRDSINAPIQGTSGEMTVLLFTILEWRLPPENIFWNTVHDSVMYYVPKQLLLETIETITFAGANLPIELLFNVDPGVIPMRIDISLSNDSWGEYEEIDDLNNIPDLYLS